MELLLGFLIGVGFSGGGMMLGASLSDRHPYLGGFVGWALGAAAAVAFVHFIL